MSFNKIWKQREKMGDRSSLGGMSFRNWISSLERFVQSDLMDCDAFMEERKGEFIGKT